MTVPLTGDEVQFGRAEDCDIVLVADEVSRHHAKVCWRSNGHVLYDLKSLNGTYVNRQRVVERMLSHMDEIWFGSKCRIVYRDDTKLGKHAAQTKAPSESQLLRDMEAIRDEMTRVGNNMSMIGRRSTTAPAGAPAAAPPVEEATEQDLARMARAYRRMEALHKASQVMASNFDLHRRLADVLDLVMQELEADRGFVMLYDEKTKNLTVKVAREMGQELDAGSPSMGIAGRAAIDGEPVLMSNRNEDREFGMRESIIQSRINSAMCVPLKLADRRLGSIYIDTRRLDVAFNEEDLELFSALAAQAAFAIDNVRLYEENLEAEKRRQNFGRFLPQAIVDKIMSEDSELALGGQKTLATTLFCDIRGSSLLAERLTPQQLVELLNEHFTALTELIFNYHGTLDKYIGDEIMAVFGAPLSTGDDVFNAVRAALAIQQRCQELNVLRAQEDKPEVRVGIGIDTGEVIAGYIGSPRRMEFTVVGDRVNTAKRFCDMAEPGKIVVGEQTWENVGDRLIGNRIGTVMLRGKGRPAAAYQVMGLRT